MSHFFKQEIEIELTPEEAAAAFAEFGSDEQAAFFNKLAELVKDWKAPFCFQMQHIMDCDCPALTSDARTLMQTIGEYAK